MATLPFLDSSTHIDRQKTYLGLLTVSLTSIMMQLGTVSIDWSYFVVQTLNLSQRIRVLPKPLSPAHPLKHEISAMRNETSGLDLLKSFCFSCIDASSLVHDHFDWSLLVSFRVGRETLNKPEHLNLCQRHWCQTLMRRMQNGRLFQVYLLSLLCDQCHSSAWTGAWTATHM